MKQNLFLLSALQVSPLVQRLAQVHAVHGDLYLTDHVVFGETVKVINLQHQSLPTQLCIRDLGRCVYVVRPERCCSSRSVSQSVTIKTQGEADRRQQRLVVP